MLTSEYLYSLNESEKVAFYAFKLEQLLASQSYKYSNFPGKYELSEKEPVLVDCYDYESVDSVSLVDEILRYSLFQTVQALLFESTTTCLDMLIASNNDIIDRKVYPRLLRNKLISRLKLLASVDAAEKKLPQAGVLHICYREQIYIVRILFIPHQEGDNFAIFSTIDD